MHMYIYLYKCNEITTFLNCFGVFSVQTIHFSIWPECKGLVKETSIDKQYTGYITIYCLCKERVQQWPLDNFI